MDEQKEFSWEFATNGLTWHQANSLLSVIMAVVDALEADMAGGFSPLTIETDDDQAGEFSGMGTVFAGPSGADLPGYPADLPGDETSIGIYKSAVVSQLSADRAAILVKTHWLTKWLADEKEA